MSFWKEQKTRRSWLIAAIAVFLTTAGIAVFLYLSWQSYYRQKIYPNVTAGGLRLGGLGREQAEKILQEKIAVYYQNGLVFYYGETAVVIRPAVASAESDLAYQLIDFQPEATVAAAWQIGRSGRFWNDLAFLFLSLRRESAVWIAYEARDKEIEKILRDNLAGREEPAVDAALVFEKNRYLISPEKDGVVLDYEQTLADFRNRLDHLSQEPILIAAKRDQPRLTQAACAGLEKEAENMLAAAPIRLLAADHQFTIAKKELSGLIVLRPLADRFGQISPAIGLDPDNAGRILRERISPQVNQEPVDAKFTVADGKVSEFQQSHDGSVLDIDASFSVWEKALRAGTSSVPLAMRTVRSEISAADVNSLGIKEVIGIGHSNFSGSPANRRHNIKTGADALHGLLIKPAETFSLVAALGEIDGASGYLPELVIKGNKTTPEFGGGLCQIGTTMFRAALDTGLPITERRNHSYRVSYYEPAGTDATIYSPKPDFRFENDTGHYLLIQSRLEGNDLYFDIWGTPDGRIATRTRPTIFNIVKPGPTVYIETLDLKPGEKKCTEKAHNGADAYFDYSVLYPDGTNKEERIKSHYMPWREVCLLGVEELSAPAGPEEASASTSVPLLD
ncbi:hypothetical protein COX69_01260 [Candidatus Falkowbacteria bacterium CG_4_10_14_0_2_um_filter_48_10]|uniref:YoaR-like putative peptidoglycan binding domain-containing protein n=1 Tax=Candidatus Falkowbacteria bacterium CG23_combo_of_CG06-09_8_20_14_all_49_15 TaxID=1974572 RepID=A0A2G9ZLV4_9BACT|nr:MAG: hypothetical protein COX22_00585 [Candidatus Falkowbacteria bacterium CG23_combo_of_CG06-09_8_20_14_all_49_15]PJA08794.1 MAG: hypothetical protein COX69_01260 [Candidatus Falkowbacteria bacterium CG_4_10_14_0_2_um_filter_48_10]